LDTLNPATAGEARRFTIMARKTYSEEFRRQAVELYRSAPGATLRGIATDLGITRGTLATWIAALDPDPTTGTTDAAAPATSGGTARPRPGSPQAELAALRARVAALETETTLLATERDILRQAAKYFAGETRW
jgi:transposase